jgi:hypothetical protein
MKKGLLKHEKDFDIDAFFKESPVSDQEWHTWGYVPLLRKNELPDMAGLYVANGYVSANDSYWSELLYIGKEEISILQRWKDHHVEKKIQDWSEGLLGRGDVAIHYKVLPCVSSEERHYIRKLEHALIRVNAPSLNRASLDPKAAPAFKSNKERHELFGTSPLRAKAIGLTDEKWREVEAIRQSLGLSDTAEALRMIIALGIPQSRKLI